MKSNMEHTGCITSNRQLIFPGATFAAESMMLNSLLPYQQGAYGKHQTRRNARIPGEETSMFKASSQASVLISTAFGPSSERSCVHFGRAQISQAGISERVLDDIRHRVKGVSMSSHSLYSRHTTWQRCVAASLF